MIENVDFTKFTWWKVIVGFWIKKWHESNESVGVWAKWLSSEVFIICWGCRESWEDILQYILWPSWVSFPNNWEPDNWRIRAPSYDVHAGLLARPLSLSKGPPSNHWPRNMLISLIQAPEKFKNSMHRESSASFEKGQKRKCQILNADNQTLIDYLLLRLGLLSLRKVLDCVKGRWNHKTNPINTTSWHISSP